MSRRVKIGLLADSNYGLRISKSGFDADANPPVPANLIFDSQWPQLLPIYQSGIIASNAGSTVSANFSQLGYIPLFSILIKPAGGTTWLSNPQYLTQAYQPPNGGTAISYLQIWVTNSYIGVTNFTSGKDPSWPSQFSIAYIIYKVSGG